MLATQAATNLTSKLAKSFHAEKNTHFEGNKEEAISLIDRITGLVRHMLDMSKQLELRIDSYYKEVMKHNTNLTKNFDSNILLVERFTKIESLAYYP